MRGDNFWREIRKRMSQGSGAGSNDNPILITSSATHEAGFRDKFELGNLFLCVLLSAMYNGGQQRYEDRVTEKQIFFPFKA